MKRSSISTSQKRTPSLSVEEQKASQTILTLMQLLTVTYNLSEALSKRSDCLQKIATHITRLNECITGQIQPVFAAYWINKIKQNTDETKFLNFLLAHGLRLDFFQLEAQALMEACFQQDNISFFRWLLGRCQLGGVAEYLIRYVAQNPLAGCSTYFLEHCPPSVVMMLAIRHDQLALLAWLIESKGYNINDATLNGLTPLAEAYSKDNEEIIYFLLTKGAKTDGQLNNRSFLEYAITNYGVEHVKKLLEKFCEQGFSPAQIITSFGDNLAQFAIRKSSSLFIEIAHLLTDIDPTIPDRNGFNLAVFACLVNQPKSAEWLINNNPELDLQATFNDGMTLLHLCIAEKREYSVRTATIKWLIEECHFNLEATTSSGETPMLLAARLNEIGALHYLLWRTKKTVNFQAKNHKMEHIGHYLAKHSDSKILISRLFGTKGVHCLLNPDVDGQTMLDLLLEQGKTHYAIVKECIDYIHKRNKSKHHSKFLLTSINRLPQLLEFYCEYQDDELSPWVAEGQPPLHIACVHTDRSFVEQFIGKYQLDINRRNNNKETALCYMIRQKKTKDAIWFIQTFNPKKTQLDKFKSTLLQLACEAECMDLIEWCFQQKQMMFSILKQREDGFNALDIALVKKNSQIFTCLWGRLKESERATYIQSLHQSNETQSLDFLIKHDLYVPVSTSLPIQDANPNFSAMVTDKTEVAAQQEGGGASATTASIPIERFTCDAEMLQKAIDSCLLDYIQDLKHYPEYNDLVRSHADELLRGAVAKNNYLFLYHVLRVPALNEQAHLNSNAALLQASTLGYANSARCLLRLSAVQDNISIDDHAIYKIAVKNKYRDIINLLKNHSVIQTFIQENPAYIDEEEEIHSILSASASASIVEQSVATDSPPTPDDPELAEPTNWDSIFSVSGYELDPLAPHFQGLPKSYACNPYLKARMLSISTLFKQSSCEGYLYGSGLYKVQPGDFDILLPDTTSAEASENVRALIHLFIADGGIVTAYMPDGAFGYKKTNRYVIPMDWKGIKLEFLVSEKKYTEHAQMLDFTIGARYFNLNSLTMFSIDGVDAYRDTLLRELKTISDPYDCFSEDWSRIFRGVRLVAAGDFHFAADTESAIQHLFSGTYNPFISNANPGKLYQQLQLLFASDFSSQNIDVLNDLGVLDKVFESLYCFNHGNTKITARYYIAQLNASCRTIGLQAPHDPLPVVEAVSYSSSSVCFFQSSATNGTGQESARRSYQKR